MKSIFERVSKAVVSFISSADGPVMINSPEDYSRLPVGFFRVFTTSGKEQLGYNPPPATFTRPGAREGEVIQERVPSSFGFSLDVRESFTLGGRIVKLEVPRESLPIVRLNYYSPSSGVTSVGGRTLLDTTSVEGFDGNFEYIHSDPSRP